jgi:glucan phosphoethanolaminetransferase (alkaline phosphatase superfamily)
MDNQAPVPGKFAMNYGIILGLIMIVISVLMYVTGLALEGEQWPQFLYYIIFPIVIIYAINQFKKKNANILSLGQAIKVGLAIAVVSALVYAVYGLIFNYIIDPDFMGQMMDVTRDKMLETPDMTEELVDQQMEFIKIFFNPVLGTAMWVAMSALFGLIYSVIGGLIMRKEA